MADIDLKSAKASFKDEIYSSVCFHAQQAVEKSFKAFLLNFSKEVIKTHDLLFLFSKVLKYEKSLKKFKKSVEFLNKFYIPTRYPDAFPGSLVEGLPGEKDASRALEEAEKVLELVSQKIKFR